MAITNAVGSEAISSNTEGFDNVAQGTDALKNNTGGFINTAIGHQVYALSCHFRGLTPQICENARQRGTDGNNQDGQLRR